MRGAWHGEAGRGGVAGLPGEHDVLPSQSQEHGAPALRSGAVGKYDLRIAISRAATSRGMSVETLEGEGFIAVRKAEKPSVRKSAQASSEQGKRRERPPKRQE